MSTCGRCHSGLTPGAAHCGHCGQAVPANRPLYAPPAPTRGPDTGPAAGAGDQTPRRRPVPAATTNPGAPPPVGPGPAPGTPGNPPAHPPVSIPAVGPAVGPVSIPAVGPAVGPVSFADPTAPVGAVSVPPGPYAPSAGPARRGPWLVITSVLGGLAVIAGALAVTVALRSRDTAATAAAPSTTVAPTTTTAAPTTTTTAAPTTTTTTAPPPPVTVQVPVYVPVPQTPPPTAAPAPAPPSRTTRVFRVRQDVYARFDKYESAATHSLLRANSNIELVCDATGGSYRDGDSGQTSSWWAMTAGGRWVAEIYIDGAHAALPVC